MMTGEGSVKSGTLPQFLFMHVFLSMDIDYKRK